WDEVRAVFRDTRAEPKPPAVPAPAREDSHDATGVFSSLPEETVAFAEAFGELETSSPPRYVVFAVAACLLVAAVLYVWAPGHSYLGKLASVSHGSGAKPKLEAPPSATPAVESLVQEASEEKPSAATESPAPDDLALVENNPPDPPPVTTGPIDPSKIQIIETKVIPRPGSQQPPKNGVNDPAQPATADPPSAAAAPASPPEPHPSLPRPPVVPPAPHPEPPPSLWQTAHAPGEGRTGVIIPDSLKNSPAASPA